MRSIKIYKLLLTCVFALTILSCDTSDETDSVITRFSKFPVTTTTTSVVAPEEDEETYTFNFTMDGTKQVNPIVLEVLVGSNSTAEEGVDFELSTHEIELDAFEGQDGFDIDITVLQDFEIEPGANETIYLTFKTVDPSGVDDSQVLVVTIDDSGLLPQPGETADFALSWNFTDEVLAGENICDYTANLDLDVTIQTAGTDPYDDDLMDYAASTAVCIEQGTVDITSMVDGEVYDIWVFIYGDVDYGDLSALTVSLSYTRENTDFDGFLEVEDVFDTRQEEDGAIIGTLQRNGNVLTLKDADGDVVAQGRVSGKRIQMIHNVKKPS